MPIRMLQTSLQENYFECLGAKLPSSISVCGETLLNSSYYTKISQQDLPSQALFHTGSGKKNNLALEYSH